MDIAKCTEDLTCLTQAVIKLRGKEGGFIQEKMQIYCWGKLIQVQFVPKNTPDFCCYGNRSLLGRKPKEEDEVDVAKCTETFDLTGSAEGNPLLATVACQRKGRSDGQMGDLLGHYPKKSKDFSSHLSPLNTGLQHRSAANPVWVSHPSQR